MRIADYIAKQRRDITRFSRVVSTISTIAFGSLFFVSNNQMRIWLFLLIAFLAGTLLVGSRMGSRIRCPGCHSVLVNPPSQPPESRCPICALDFSRPMPGKSP